MEYNEAKDLFTVNSYTREQIEKNKKKDIENIENSLQEDLNNLKFDDLQEKYNISEEQFNQFQSACKDETDAKKQIEKIENLIRTDTIGISYENNLDKARQRWYGCSMETHKILSSLAHDEYSKKQKEKYVEAINLLDPNDIIATTVILSRDIISPDDIQDPTKKYIYELNLKNLQLEENLKNEQSKNENLESNLDNEKRTNETLKQQNNGLTQKVDFFIKNYAKIYDQFNQFINQSKENEEFNQENYNNALNQISAQQEKINSLEKASIFNVIKSKITRLFKKEQTNNENQKALPSGIKTSVNTFNQNTLKSGMELIAEFQQAENNREQTNTKTMSNDELSK